MIKKITSLVLMISMVVVTSGILSPVMAMAASVSQASAIFGRLKLSTPAESVIVQYKTPTGVAAAGTILLDFGTSFTLGTLTYANIDMAISNDNTCAAFTNVTLAAAATGTTWGASVTGNAVTLTSDSGTVGADFCVQVKFGTAAIVGGTGTASDVLIGSSATDPTIEIGGSGDTGVLTIALVDDDQVTVTAMVNQTLGFDLDTTTPALDSGGAPYYSSANEVSGPYSVALGTLNVASVTSSGGSINMIVAEAFTNASGGMNITVENANGASGLVSGSTPTSTIPSATAAMSVGTANYGLCVATADLVGLTRTGNYSSGTCALSGTTNNVVGLTTTPESILSASGPISDSHAEVVVNAAISTSTKAHLDYQDTLTFIATASF